MRKVGIGQRLCNCVNVFLGGGATHRQGEVWKEDLKFLCESSLHCLCCGKIVAKYIVEKLAMVKDFVIVQMVNFRGGGTDHCLRPISNIETMSTKCLFAMPSPIFLETEISIELKNFFLAYIYKLRYRHWKDFCHDVTVSRG